MGAREQLCDEAHREANQRVKAQREAGVETSDAAWYAQRNVVDTTVIRERRLLQQNRSGRAEHPMDRLKRRLLEQNQNSREHPADRLKRVKRRLLQQNRY